MGVGEARDFSTFFYSKQTLWDFLKMEAAALLLFTLFAWGPPLLRSIGPMLPMEAGHSFFNGAQEFDRWLVAPQVRLLLFFSDTLEKVWPGPLAGALTDQHRFLLALFHGAVGLAVGWIVFRLYEWWSLRWAWLAVGFLTWGFFFQVFTFTFFHVVDETQRLLGSTSLYR